MVAPMARKKTTPNERKSTNAMICKSITVENFRNIDSASVRFSDGVNILLGNNAQGKTNLLEAIYVTSLGRSFRAQGDADMIKFGADYATIQNVYRDNMRDMELTMSIFSGRKQKVIHHNRVKVQKMSDLVGAFKVVLFSPEHLSIIKEGPSLRRGYLDVAISQIKPMYIKALQRYNSILKERNSLIKSAEDNRRNFDSTIDLWSEQLAEVAAIITKYRIEYLNEAIPHIEKCFAEMTGEREVPTLTYESSSGLTPDECLDTEKCREAYLNLYNTRHDREIGAGATLWGIHKDDIEIQLNGKIARFYCSQGQQRSLSLAMKLAEGEIIKKYMGGDYPVFLLDDVFSELDSKRRAYLVNNLKDKQVIMTSCEPHDLDGANVIIVEDGVYTPKNTQ